MQDDDSVARFCCSKQQQTKTAHYAWNNVTFGSLLNILMQTSGYSNVVMAASKWRHLANE